MLNRSNDPVPVETRLQLVLAGLAHEMTVAEAARRHGVSASRSTGGATSVGALEHGRLPGSYEELVAAR